MDIKFIFFKNKNLKEKQIFLIIALFSFFIHLLAINFHPTNLEGGYGAYSNFFENDNKINYIKSYYFTQFNSYIFPLLGSIINEIFPLLDGYQCIKILSSFSYFFFIYGFVNLCKFFNIKINFRIVFLILLNPIIWYYGFRAYNDLFAFSLALFSFSKILTSKYSYKENLYLVILGFAAAIKIYALIFLPFIFFLKNTNNFSKSKKIIFFYKIILSLLPLLVLNIITYKYFDFILSPENQDLQIAFFGNDETRDIIYVFNNFVFYIGYICLITLPFTFFLYLNNTYKNKVLNYITLLFVLFFSIFIQEKFFIASELDLGPLQMYIPDNIYKTAIIFLFFVFFIILINMIFYSQIKKKLALLLLIIITYCFFLSFIKASQRYLILPLPLFIIFLFFCDVFKNKVINYLTIAFYIFINTALLFNYFLLGKSIDDVYKFLYNSNITHITHPGDTTPHTHHLYNNNPEIILKDKISLANPKYIISKEKKNIIYETGIYIFDREFKMFYVNVMD